MLSVQLANLRKLNDNSSTIWQHKIQRNGTAANEVGVLVKPLST